MFNPLAICVPSHIKSLLFIKMYRLRRAHQKWWKLSETRVKKKKKKTFHFFFPLLYGCCFWNEWVRPRSTPDLGRIPSRVSYWEYHCASITGRQEPTQTVVFSKAWKKCFPIQWSTVDCGMEMILSLHFILLLPYLGLKSLSPITCHK